MHTELPALRQRLWRQYRALARRRRVWMLVVVAALLPACKDKAPEPTAPAACKGAVQEGPLAWFEDNYQAAIDCAASRKQPLVVAVGGGDEQARRHAGGVAAVRPARHRGTWPA
jgi:hypothetical protein